MLVANMLGMLRIARVVPGEMTLHVLNRGNGRRTICEVEIDGAAFVR